MHLPFWNSLLEYSKQITDTHIARMKISINSTIATFIQKKINAYSREIGFTC